MGVDRAQSCGCCSGSGGAGAKPSAHFTDYAHQNFALASGGAAVPETLISQWACDFDPLGTPIDLFLQLIAASPAGMMFRVREGGTIDAPDGNILLAAFVQDATPTHYCFANPAQTPGTQFCSQLKLTVESTTIGIYTINARGIHLEARRT